MGIRDTEMIWWRQRGFWAWPLVMGEVQRERSRPRSIQRKSVARQPLCSHRVNLFTKYTQRGKHGKKPQLSNCKPRAELQTGAFPARGSETKGEIFYTGTCTQIHTWPGFGQLGLDLDYSPCKQHKIQVFSLLGSNPRSSRVQSWLETELVLSNFS